MPLIHGDPGFVLGFDWQTGEHSFDETMTIYVCASDGPSTVTLEPLPDGITASPSTFTLARTGTGHGAIIPVRLTVARGAAGLLRVTQTFDGGGGGETGGPEVVADTDAWHLEPGT